MLRFQSFKEKAFYLLLLSAIFIVYAPPFVGDSLAYTVAPLILDVEVQPRDIITKKITVTNTGEQPVTLYPTVNNISMKEGGTMEVFVTPVESDRTTSLASWIEISRRGIDLKPQETETIEMTLRINPESVPGVYHAFIGFGSGRNRDEAEAQVRGGRAPGTIVNVTIEDKKNELLKLSQFVVDKFLTGKNDKPAFFTFKNPGDETVVPTGEIIVYDSSGKEIKAIKLNTENVAIPAGSEHSFEAHIPQDGLFGKYKAYLSIEYGTEQRATVQDTNFFYAFPIKHILIVVGILFMLVIIGSWYVHKRYFDEEIDDSDHLTFHIRESKSESKEHDIDLKQK